MAFPATADRSIWLPVVRKRIWGAQAIFPSDEVSPSLFRRKIPQTERAKRKMNQLVEAGPTRRTPPARHNQACGRLSCDLRVQLDISFVSVSRLAGAFPFAPHPDEVTNVEHYL
jgi:hypothetical protein